MKKKKSRKNAETQSVAAEALLMAATLSDQAQAAAKRLEEKVFFISTTPDFLEGGDPPDMGEYPPYFEELRDHLQSIDGALFKIRVLTKGICF